MSFRFQQFRVYQDAKALHTLTHRFTRAFSKDFGYLADQMNRASLSIVLNIAEGSGKKSDREFNRYLQNALGSANELGASYDIAYAEKLLLEADFQKATKMVLDVRNQLGGFSKKLAVVS